MYRNIINIPLLLISLVVTSNSFSQDPMRPPSWMTGNKVETSNKGRALNLQQILISKDRKLAVINEVVVTEGERVSGARVKSISEQWVKVTRSGRTITLRITPTTKVYSREK